jgi:hypothetical protein
VIHDYNKVNARFSMVERRLWNDIADLTPIKPCGAGLWVYLLTTPYLGVLPGLIVAGEAMLAENLKWEIKPFRKAYAELERKGMVRADWASRLVMLPKVVNRYFERGGPENPNVVRGWRRQWLEVPPCELGNEYRTLLGSHIKGLGEGYGKAFDEAFGLAPPTPSPKHSRPYSANKEKEKDLPPNPPPSGGDLSSPGKTGPEAGNGLRPSPPPMPPPSSHPNLPGLPADFPLPRRVGGAAR